MSELDKEMLREIMTGWSDVQIHNYIKRLEENIKHSRETISYLNSILRKRKKVTVDTGARDGR